MHKTKFIVFFIMTISNCIFSQQSDVNIPEEDVEIYKVVQEMPRFPGCESIPGSPKQKEDCAKEKMAAFIYENLVYPETAIKESTEGMAVVQFTIWKDSTLRNIKVVRDPGHGTGAAAAEVVAKMRTLTPKWRPGHQRGKPVCVQYTLPVKFKLNNDSNYQNRSHHVGIKMMNELHDLPRFPDCAREKNRNCTKELLEEFIAENQLYPEDDFENEIEGTVRISFIIKVDGTLSNIEALNHVSDGLNNDAKEIFHWMNSEQMKWVPGKINNVAVPTQYYVDVVYDIDEWESKK